MNFPIKDLFSKIDQIDSLLQIRSHLQNKYLMEKFIFLCGGNSSNRIEIYQIVLLV